MSQSTEIYFRAFFVSATPISYCRDKQGLSNLKNIAEKEETYDTATYGILSHHLEICHIARTKLRANVKPLIG